MEYLHSLINLPIKGPIYIYGAGQRGVAFKRRLEAQAPHITITGFLSTDDQGTVEGLPLNRLADVRIPLSTPIIICSWASGEIAEKLSRRKYDNVYLEVQPRLQRPSIGAVFTTTMRCNIACPFCFNDMHERRAGRDWTFERFLKAFDCISGADEFVFGGGEPLLNAATGDMLAHCKSRGKQTAFLTNGLLLDRRDKLAPIIENTNRIVVSINSNDDRIQQQFIPTSTADLIQDLTALTRRHSHVTLEFNTVLHKHNFFHIHGILEIAMDLGVCAVSFNSIILKDHHDAFIRDAALCNLAPDEKRRFVDHFEGVRAESGNYPMVVHFTDFLIRDLYEDGPQVHRRVERSREKLTRKCAMPWNFFGVNNDGGIRPCCGSPGNLIVGNVFDREKIDFNARVFQDLRGRILSGDLRRECRICTTMPLAPRLAVNNEFVSEFNAAGLVDFSKS